MQNSKEINTNLLAQSLFNLLNKTIKLDTNKRYKM